MTLQKTFGEDELDANRNGHLTQAQINMLRSKRIRKALKTYALAGVLTFLGAMYLFPEFSSGRILLMISVWLISGTLWLLPRWKAYTLDTQLDEVASVRGDIILDIQENRTRNGTEVNYFLQISDYSFQISKDILLTLKNGEPYRVYFTPRSKMFLSAEPLDAFSTLADEKPKHDQVVRLGDDGELIYEKPKRQQ